MKKSAIIFFITLFFSVLWIQLKAQVITGGFEGYADEANYTHASWTADGFTVPWVNGFDVGRGKVDNAYKVSGTNSLRIFYPVNNFGPANSGAQAPLMLTPADQYYMSYWVRFDANFSWGNTNEGGKLPGLAGGNRCSGCTVCTGTNGFSARLMWRPGGRLVLYLYHMEADKANPPCGDNNTLQVGGVDYYITKGQWFKITERVKVNTGSNHDGEVELWINDQPALLRTGIQFVTNGDKVNSFYFSTFHGGSTSGWSPTNDSYTWFDDIRISTNPADIFTSLGLQEENNQLVESQNGKDEVVVYPLPLTAGGVAFLSGLKNQEGASVAEWFDTTGKLQSRYDFDSSIETVQVPMLEKGIYILRVSSNRVVNTIRVAVE